MSRPCCVICVNSKSKRKRRPPEPLSPPTGYIPHTFNVPAKLEERVKRCMKLEELTNFTEFANSALGLRCRKTEQEHAIDAEGKPLTSG